MPNYIFVKEQAEAAGPIRHKEYIKCLEYFDFTDKETRTSLIGIHEEDQSRVLMSLTTRLYDQIMNKVDDIDYGEIPRTKGDITKLSNYKGMRECLSILADLFREYKQDTAPVDTIEEALNNIEKRKEVFQKGFIVNKEFVIFLYDTMTLSVVQALSLLISTSIEFIKSPTDECYDMILNNVAVAKTYRHLLFDDLKKFNAACKVGDVDKALDFMMQAGRDNFLGFGVGATAGVIVALGCLLNIIPILRELIYFYYHIRVRISDWTAVQADILQLNAYNLEHNRSSMSIDDRKKVAKKQMKVVEALRKVSNVVAIDAATAEKKATTDIVKDSKTKYKASDVMDSMPDSVETGGSSVF